MDNGDYWSATWQPVKNPLDDYKCRHGPSYTKIMAKKNGIESEILYFTPLEDNCELWVLKLRNDGSETRRLKTFSYVEYSFPHALADITNLDWTNQIMRGIEEDGVLYMISHGTDSKFYHASSETIAGFDTDRSAFIGPYRDLGNPQVLEEGESKESEAPNGNIIGSISHEVELDPGEERRIVHVLGDEYADNSRPILSKYRSLEKVDAEFERLQDNWREYFEKLQVDTPDEEMNAMLNRWNPIQCRTTLYWSRSASLYQTGTSRGMGTRDSSQDTFGVVHAASRSAKKKLEMLWELQFEDGHTWHQIYPLTGEGGPGLAAEEPEKPQWFSDDPLWLILGTCNYMKETGDTGFLEKRIPYQDAEPEPVWNHMRRAIDFTDTHRGVYEIPRIGYSDWNDTLNLDHGSGKAASVWTGMMFSHVLREMEKICRRIGKEKKVQRYGELRREMKNIINEHCWDGGWYMRAFDDKGRPIGTSKERYQKISLNPQTWSVISGVAEEGRGETAMEKAHEKLNTRFGFALMHPPYEGEDERIGGTTTFLPGAKENGGIFCHAHTWSMVAAAKLGWGNRAYQYYRQLLPLAYNDECDLRRTEPYVYCQNILGPEHPDFGRAANSWLSGTASWSYVAGTQWILGIRPDFDGLRIDPCIPPKWSGYKVIRKFRGSRYDVEVKNPEGVAKGIESISVDGEELDGELVPAFEDGNKHKVRAVLG